MVIGSEKIEAGEASEEKLTTDYFTSPTTLKVIHSRSYMELFDNHKKLFRTAFLFFLD